MASRTTYILLTLGTVLILIAVFYATRFTTSFVYHQSSPEHTSEYMSSSTADKTGEVVTTPQDDTIDILFVGDMNFDRHIRRVILEKGADFVFSCIDPLLQSADFVVGNLEGPITEHSSVSLGSVVGSPQNYQFTFPTSTEHVLREHNITVVNIGNNHIGDFGLLGVSTTRMFLRDAGISYFGGLVDNSTVHRMTLNGIDLSFVSYNQFGGDSPQTVAESIAEEHARGAVVIVYTHWGEEYIEHTAQMKNSATLFAEHGADLIIGSHPHVIQSQEKIGDTIVYYSLGNFIFDQYWMDSVKTGLVVHTRISKDDITVQESRVVMHKDGRTCPLEVQ